MAAMVAQTVQGSDHTAAWLAFIGAILVALIAAVTAQWRLRVQLRHDRELADLRELREILDGAAAATWDFADKAGDVYAARHDWFDSERGTAEEREAAQRALGLRGEAYRILWPTEHTLARLVLRLGEDHNVVRAFYDWRKAASDLLQPQKVRPEVRPSASEASSVRLKTARQTFIENTRPITRSRVQGA